MIFYLLDFRLWIIRVQCWVASIHWWIWTIFTFPYLRFMAEDPYQTFRFFHWVGSWALTTWSLSSRKRLHNNAALCWLSCNVSSYYFAIHALGNELIIFFMCLWVEVSRFSLRKFDFISFLIARKFLFWFLWNFSLNIWVLDPVTRLTKIGCEILSLNMIIPNLITFIPMSQKSRRYFSNTLLTT